MYEKITLNDKFYNRRRALLDKGTFRLNHLSKMCYYVTGASFRTPWLYIAPARRKFCFYWNQIFRSEFGLIPGNCRFNCWKVVIKPRNLKELLKLTDILHERQFPSKLGIDRRDYTYGPWAGFVYGDSIEEGQKYARKLRKLLDERISPDVPLVLKRGCTEMEAIKPSNEWDEMSPEEILLERRLNDSFEFEENETRHSAWMIEDIKYRWLRHAIQIGDPTAKECAIKLSGDPDAWSKLVVESVTYPYKLEDLDDEVSTVQEDKSGV